MFSDNYVLTKHMIWYITNYDKKKLVFDSLYIF